MSAARRLVSVVDDDESVRESLPDLLNELGFDAEAFSSAEDLLDSEPIGRTDCLILDVSMPGLSGPEVQRELIRRGSTIPVIFITAHADAAAHPELAAPGAVACLCKPFSEAALLNALRFALGVR